MTEQSKRADRGTTIVFGLTLLMNFILLAVSLCLLFGGLPRPPAWAVIVVAALPWAASAVVWIYPTRCVFFPMPGERRLTLFGTLFLASLGSLGTIGFAAPLARSVAILFACLAGVALLSVVGAGECRAKGNLFCILIVLPLSFGYGYASVIQLNCTFDRSPIQVHRAVVAYKSWAPGRAPHISIRPWDGGSGLRRTPIPEQLYAQVAEGGPVCVAERSGAFGIRWYTVEACR